MSYPEKTLRALEHYKHHLNGAHEDLSAGQEPGMMLISCSDSRIMGSKILNPLPGNVFTHDNIGAMVQPKEETDHNLDAFLHYPLMHLKGIHTIMIMGHTGCGGIKALTQSILNDAPRGSDDITEWVVPLSDEKITSAVKRAKEQGMSDADIASAMEQIMPLRSAQRLLERKLTHDGRETTVAEVLRKRNIQVVPAVYDLKANRLFVFDPDEKHYCEPQQMTGEFQKRLAFKKGSTSTLGATVPISALDSKIQGLLNDLSAGRKAPELQSSM